LQMAEEARKPPALSKGEVLFGVCV
jgi:hypothetical protein